MIRLLHANEIKSIQTTSHAHTVERFIRTFKMNLYRRLDSLNEDNTKWVNIYIYIYIYDIINKYNSTEHSITQTKPNEAVKTNHLWINWHLQNAAKRNRKHPEIKKAIWLD